MNFENDLNEDEPQEREISLGTATIVGIFLVLALICAAFFGFGYSLGRHSTPAVTAAPTPEKADPKSDNTFSNFKTAPDAAGSESDAPEPAPVKATKSAQPAAPKQPTAPETVSTHASSAALPATSSGGQFVVQVSATTRQSDAESLLAALKRKGYTAVVKQEADSRFHVQVGPFASKADAETTRKQLDADGYKGPFIK